MDPNSQFVGNLETSRSLMGTVSVCPPTIILTSFRFFSVSATLFNMNFPLSDN